MTVQINPNKLILEEKKAIKLFLWMFYILYFGFEIFYYRFNPLETKSEKLGFLSEGLGIWTYILILGLLLPAIYYLKKRNPYIVKYIVAYGFVLTDIANYLAYFHQGGKDISANLVEVLFIIFSPIFVNKKYFLTVSSLFVGKHIFLGIITQNSKFLFPAVVYLTFCLIVYIILIRFYSYINSLKNVHEDLRKKEKLAVIGQMAAAIGHEIRNPLASLKGFTQLQHERYPNTNEFYPIMIQEVDRINSIVNDLMYLGKPKAVHFEEENIEEIIAYTLSITQQQASKQGVTLETLMEGPLPPIECDGKQLKQVFINLIKNAVEAMPNGGKIKIKVKVFQKNKVTISIKDQGCGIKEEDISTLGEPFFTTKKDGTGLGLMVTNQIIDDHGGELKFNSKLGIGTKVEVILPITQITVQNSRIVV